MFQGYRVVCVTPAGRRRYMELLVPQVLACGLVDRYDIWMNTDHPADRKFLDSLAKLDRVRLVPHPDRTAPGTEAIGGFHRTAMDADTIYIRLDDDVVWLEPGFFDTLLRFRVAHPDYFLVMPLIVNNALCSHLLQTMGKITVSHVLNTACFDPVGWRSARFALQLHRLLLDLIRSGVTDRLHCGAHVVALNRFSINSICWFGRDLASFGGVVGVEEELEMSAVIPARLGKVNCFCADTVAAHFAFFSQRAKLDEAGILEQYTEVLTGRSELRALLEEVGALRRAADTAETILPQAQGGFAPVRKPSLLHRWLGRRPEPDHVARAQKVELSPGPGLLLP